MRMSRYWNRLKRWWYRQSGSERLMVSFQAVIALATIVALLQWSALRKANDLARRNFEASERAAVNLGGPDGTLAELKEQDGEKAILLHFFNSGTVAKRVSINAWTDPQHPPPLQHLSRYQVTMVPPGMNAVVSNPVSIRNGVEVKVCGQCSYIDEVPEYRLPSADRLAAMIKPPKGPPGPFPERLEVDGEIEYCDLFGEYHCEAFTLQYIPLPVGRFLQAVNIGHCGLDAPIWKSTPQGGAAIRAFMAKFGNVTFQAPIARCPQPGDLDEQWEEQEGPYQITPSFPFPFRPSATKKGSD